VEQAEKIFMGGYLGLEVIYYMAVVIGEWCKIRTDPMFDVITAEAGIFFATKPLRQEG